MKESKKAVRKKAEDGERKRRGEELKRYDELLQILGCFTATLITYHVRLIH